MAVRGEEVSDSPTTAKRKGEDYIARISGVDIGVSLFFFFCSGLPDLLAASLHRESRKTMVHEYVVHNHCMVHDHGLVRSRCMVHDP